MGVRSFALWYIEKDDIKQNVSVESGVEIDKTKESRIKNAEVHINLWNNSKSGKEKLSYVDLGIFIDNIEGIDTIKFFIPAKKEKIEIIDLIERIKNSKEQLINAIFNEDYSSKHGIQAKKTLVECSKVDNKRQDFYIYELDDKNQIEKYELDGGTVVKINIGDIKVEDEQSKSHYFRIRCKIRDEVEFIKDQVNDISILNSFFTQVEIIDFRLNDIRSCKKNIKEKYENQKNFNIKKIHYLVLRNAQDEMIYFGDVKCRILEVDLWKDYFKEDFKNQDVIAYHIKKDKDKDKDKDNIEKELRNQNFTNLIRFKYEKTNWVKLTLSIFVVIFLGAISGIISTWAYENIKNPLSSQTQNVKITDNSKRMEV